jgi:hypothetical protein
LMCKFVRLAITIAVIAAASLRKGWRPALLLWFARGAICAVGRLGAGALQAVTVRSPGLASAVVRLEHAGR